MIFQWGATQSFCKGIRVRSPAPLLLFIVFNDGERRKREKKKDHTQIITVLRKLSQFLGSGGPRLETWVVQLRDRPKIRPLLWSRHLLGWTVSQLLGCSSAQARLLRTEFGWVETGHITRLRDHMNPLLQPQPRPLVSWFVISCRGLWIQGLELWQ